MPKLTPNIKDDPRHSDVMSIDPNVAKEVDSLWSMPGGNTVPLATEIVKQKKQIEAKKKQIETEYKKEVPVTDGEPAKQPKQQTQINNWDDINTNPAKKQEWLKKIWADFLNLSGSNPLIHKAYPYIIASAIPYDFKDGVLYLSAKTKFAEENISKQCFDALAQMYLVDSRIKNTEITYREDVQKKYFAKAHEDILFDENIDPAHLRIYLKLVFLRNNQTKICTIGTREFHRKYKVCLDTYSRARKCLCEKGYLIEEKNEFGQIYFRFPLIEAEEITKK